MILCAPTKSVIDSGKGTDLDHGRQAVGGARGGRTDGVLVRQQVVVAAHHHVQDTLLQVGQDNNNNNNKNEKKRARAHAHNTRKIDNKNI